MNVQRAGSWLAGKLGHEAAIVRWLRPMYEHTLWALSGGRGIAWTINAAPCRIDPRQRHRFGRHHDASVARWLAPKVKPGDVCMNVGANVGVYALQCAHWNGPDGRVVCFEPNPHARAILKRHISWNHLDDRVEVVDAAVSDQVGASMFFAEATGDGMSRLGEPNPASRAVEPITVPTVTLDTFCRTAPDWLVIDVEGFEILALRGGRRIVPQCKGVVVELHPNAWAAAGTSRSDLETLLDDLSLTLRPLSDQRDPLGEHGHVALQSVRS